MTRRVRMRTAREGYTPPAPAAAPAQEVKAHSLDALRVHIRELWDGEDRQAYWSPLPIVGSPMAMALSYEGVWENAVGVLTQQVAEESRSSRYIPEHFNPTGNGQGRARQAAFVASCRFSTIVVPYQDAVMNLAEAEVKVASLVDPTGRTLATPLGMKIDDQDFVFFNPQMAVLAARACAQETGTGEEVLRRRTMLATEWNHDDDMEMLYGELSMSYWARVACIQGTRLVRLEATYNMGVYSGAAQSTDVVVVDMVAVTTFGGPTGLNPFLRWVQNVKAKWSRKRDLKRAQEVRFVQKGNGAETYWIDRLGSPTVHLRTG